MRRGVWKSSPAGSSTPSSLLSGVVGAEHGLAWPRALRLPALRCPGSLLPLPWDPVAASGQAHGANADKACFLLRALPTAPALAPTPSPVHEALAAATIRHPKSPTQPRGRIQPPTIRRTVVIARNCWGRGAGTRIDCGRLFTCATTFLDCMQNPSPLRGTLCAMSKFSPPVASLCLYTSVIFSRTGTVGSPYRPDFARQPEINTSKTNHFCLSTLLRP